MKRRKAEKRAVPVESMVERAARPRHTTDRISSHKTLRKHSKSRLRDQTLRERAKREYVSPAKQRMEKNDGKR